MRKQFVKTKNYCQAKKICCWVSVIAKVEAGYMCFEDYDEYKIWKNQK